MTPPVSGGVPEQGLREAATELLDCLRFVAPAKRDIGNGNYAQLVAAIKRTRAALERPRPALPAPITTAMLAAALDDVFETTQWEGKGASIAPGLYAALKSQLGAALPAPEPRPETKC